MSNPSEQFSERDEIEMLLPWYVSGRLDVADRAKVDAWLKREPMLARQLALIQNEQTEAIRSNEAVTIPATVTVARAMEHMPTPRVTARGVLNGFFNPLRSFFTSPTANGVRWATAAAAVVIFVQAAAMGTLVSRQTSAGYQTASGGTALVAPNGRFALVRFADEASVKSVGDALSQLKLTVVDGPRPGNLFRVRVGDKSMDAAQYEERLSTLRALGGIVVLVTPSP